MYRSVADMRLLESGEEDSKYSLTRRKDNSVRARRTARVSGGGRSLFRAYLDLSTCMTASSDVLSVFPSLRLWKLHLSESTTQFQFRRSFKRIDGRQVFEHLYLRAFIENASEAGEFL